MTCLRSFSRFVVVWLTLAGVSAAAIPAGWIALRYDPPSGADQKGHWILVKAPEDGLAAWWSDTELARIMANDPDYVKQLETDWNPEAHPVADAAEANLLAAELARYWGGDVPQANYWAHGAMVRRGSTLEAYRWTQDGLGQRTALEQSGERPRIPAAALDPNPVDQRYDNQADVVTYGDRWGDHLLSGTLDHVYQAELNKAKRRHHPNPPPAGQVTQKTKETVQACREASLKAEMGVFENYVRGWGGLAAQGVSFGLPADCVVDPGPPTPIVNPQQVYTACDGSTHSTQAAANAVRCTSTPKTYTACDGSTHATQAAANAVRCTSTPRTYTACDGSTHSSQAGANAVRCTSTPSSYTACDGSTHATQAAANAVRCTTTPRTYTACDGSTHATQTGANAVRCTTTPRTYTACDGSTHSTQTAANAVSCTSNPPTTNPGCTISWLCGNDPDPDPNPVTPDPDPNGGGNGGGTGGGEGGTPTETHEACDGSIHTTQSAADAVVCTPPPPPPVVVNPPEEPQRFFDCKKDEHKTQAEADAVSCDPPALTPPQDDPQYTACDGTLHWSQADADAIDCYAEETDELCEQDPFAAGCDAF